MTGVIRANRSPKGPAAVYATATAAILVLLASLALTARQPPPPAIAELTPEAQHQIRQAPNQLNSKFGSANGGPGAGGLAPTTTTQPAAAGSTTTVAAAPPPIYVPAVHQCYGNPPRQISFDTQSPPCIAYWAGNNGGATTRGVTGNEIKVALLSNGADQRAVADLQTFFNRTFEFYGRQLHLDPGGQGPSSSYSGDECTYQRSVADELAAEDDFATTDPDGQTPACFLDEAAADHVVTVAGFQWFGAAGLANRSPYLWQYQMGQDQEMALAGRAICADLAGRPASYSPSAATASKPRKFGAIIQYYAGQAPPSVDLLRSQLGQCGSGLAATSMIESQQTTNGASLAQDYAQVYTADKQAVLNMQTGGVTTVFCWCQVFMEDALGPAADAQFYDPEWVVVGPQQDLDITIKAFWADAAQEHGLMGLTVDPRQVPYVETTLNQAIAAVDPGYEIDTDEATWLHTQDVYWMLLLLASGIQMAGPDLTPATFEHALQTTTFPNPYSPQMEGAVGFAGGSFSMTTDADLMWWSAAAASPLPDEGVGTWCYVDGRYTASNWPPGPASLFSGRCDA